MESSRNFRIEAIKNLKNLETPFDEFDVELEVDRLKKVYEEQLIEEATEKNSNRKKKEIAIIVGIVAMILLILFFPILSDADISKTSISTEQAIEQEPVIYGVVINGVRWATRNVNSPRTFADRPESIGMHYQWNRGVGYATNTRNASGWNSSPAAGTTWADVNNPCPEGWRLPTRAELESLSSVGCIWTDLNGVRGRLFGSYPNQIFLPATGDRHPISGILSDVGAWGGYWSSNSSINRTDNRILYGWVLTFSASAPSRVHEIDRAAGFAIRCVAIN